MGVFTSLGIALSKYHPDQVMEHLKLFWSRINIPKMIRACEEAHLWPELVFLYCHYDEWDNAALAMMERAADAWEHHSFKDIVVKVANLEIYYRALNFYLQEQPSLLTDLLQALTPRIDVNRVVKMFEKSDNIPLIKPFLLNVQSQNKKTVNSAITRLCVIQLKAMTTTILSSLPNVSKATTWFSSVKSPPTSTARTSAGRNQLPFPSKTNCSRMLSKLRLSLASQTSLRSCLDM
jgi:hypothetical protein